MSAAVMTHGRKKCYDRSGNGYRNGSNGRTILNAGTLVNVAAILFGLAASLGGFVYLSKDQLNRHESQIYTTIPQEIKEEAAAREKTRSEFLDKLGKVSDSLNTLNTHAAVQDEQSKQIVSTLAKISNQLEAVTLPRR